ncbi:hypothetical protein HOD20_00280 [archaeon]|jgi:diacylglycerol kinase (CTP)|nr:hypothetical protein [archaeon]MBT4350938.1 hypothetical protein [archaeon]MBT4647420.1 hypothetical protein [archaeon]MBT6821324.1 hypothetical protein [archaeon]MBT7392876.1 hypothetical protein [archaeon]
MKPLSFFFTKEFREEFEYRRKIFHLFLGFFTLIIINYELINLDSLKLILISFLVIGITLSILSRKYNIPIVSTLLNKFERKKYLKKFPGKGALFYLAGVLYSITFFSKEIALASITILVLGDTFANIIGRYYGKTRLHISKTKLLEGTVAGIIIATIGAMHFVSFSEALFGSMFAMVIEAVELEYFQFDDNFSVPVAAGIAISIFRMF